MFLVHIHTLLAGLDKRKRHLPDVYLPTSHRGGPGSVSGYQCGIYGAQCETWENTSPRTSVIPGSIITNAPYLFVCLRMTESLNKTIEMDWACSMRYKNT